MKQILPERLRPGDRVGVISPSNSIVERKVAFEQAIDLLEEQLDVKIEIAPHAMGRHYYSSGTVQERLDDFHQMIQDPTIKAIWFSVGGNTAIDLVDKLDYEIIRQNPKIIAGISDATTLLNAISARTGLITFLGLELTDFGTFDMPYGVSQLRRTWMNNKPLVLKPNTNWKNFDGLPTSYKGWKSVKGGYAVGTLIGGNFISFSQLMHTSYAMSFEHNILVIETYKFNKRFIHQALMELRLHDIFDQLAGLILGYCLGSDNPEDFGNAREMAEVAIEVTQDYSFPIMWVGEIGHKVENLLIPLGAIATMNADTLELSLNQPVVL